MNGNDREQEQIVWDRKRILASLERLEEGLEALSKWVWMVKGAILLLPLILGLLGWYMLDMNDRIDRRVPIAQWIERRLATDNRIERVERHVDALDDRINRYLGGPR